MTPEFLEGQTVTVSGAIPSQINGLRVISSVTADTFWYTDLQVIVVDFKRNNVETWVEKLVDFPDYIDCGVLFVLDDEAFVLSAKDACDLLLCLGITITKDVIYRRCVMLVITNDIASQHQQEFLALLPEIRKCNKVYMTEPMRLGLVQKAKQLVGRR